MGKSKEVRECREEEGDSHMERASASKRVNSESIERKFLEKSCSRDCERTGN